MNDLHDYADRPPVRDELSDLIEDVLATPFLFAGIAALVAILHFA